MHILPDVLIDNFDIVNFDKSADRFDIYLDEKKIVAIALVMGLGTTVAFAGNLTSGVETVMAVNDFTPIEVKDLPAAITEAIAKNFAESIVKEAAVEATEDGSKTYQVVLTDKEGTENTVFFNEKGEILK